IDFALILAQFGRDVVELQLCVNLPFGFSCRDFLIVEPRQAVFAERVAHLESALPQSHVVGFRSGEVLHGSAERFRRQQAHVNLHASAQAEADFIFAARDDLHQTGQLDDMFDQLVALSIVAAGFAGDENIEITDGFASAAQRSGMEGRYFFSNSACSESRPSLNISCMFVSMPLPMPGISRIFFGSLINSEICCGRASIAWAALRYERMRKESWPSISSRSAVS